MLAVISLWFGSILFDGIVVGMWLLSTKRRVLPAVICLVWGAAYPVVQLLLWSAMGSIGPGGEWLAILLGAIVTSALLWWMTSSIIPGVGCVIGVAFLAFGRLFPELMGPVSGENPYWIFGLLWNIPVAACAGAWLRRVRSEQAMPGRCAKCGYDRSGLAPGARCPECGTNRCAKCGYDLNGVATGVCPECGSGAAAIR